MRPKERLVFLFFVFIVSFVVAILAQLFMGCSSPKPPDYRTTIIRDTNIIIVPPRVVERISATMFTDSNVSAQLVKNGKSVGSVTYNYRQKYFDIDMQPSEITIRLRDTTNVYNVKDESKDSSLYLIIAGTLTGFSLSIWIYKKIKSN